MNAISDPTFLDISTEGVEDTTREFPLTARPIALHDAAMYVWDVWETACA